PKSRTKTARPAPLRPQNTKIANPAMTRTASACPPLKNASHRTGLAVALGSSANRVFPAAKPGHVDTSAQTSHNTDTIWQRQRRGGVGCGPRLREGGLSSLRSAFASSKRDENSGANRLAAQQPKVAPELE